LCPFPKHVKTLLAITINGLKVGTPECDSDDCCCRAWERQRKRRKLPRDRASHLPATSHETANIQQVSVQLLMPLYRLSRIS